MFPTIASQWASLINGNELPILTIKPAAGITAITTIKHLPNFCQNSKLSSFFIYISYDKSSTSTPKWSDTIGLFLLLKIT